MGEPMGYNLKELKLAEIRGIALAVGAAVGVGVGSVNSNTQAEQGESVLSRVWRSSVIALFIQAAFNTASMQVGTDPRANRMY